MKIDNGFKGDERRKNGGVKLSPRDWYTLLTVIILATLWLGRLQWVATAQGDKIKKVEATPLKVAVIKEKLDNLNNNFEEFKTDQKEDNREMNGKLDRILLKL